MKNKDNNIDDQTASVADQIRNGQQQVMEQVISMIDSLRADMQAQQGAIAMRQQPMIAQQAPFRSFPRGGEHPWGLAGIGGANVTIASGEFESGNGNTLATAQTSFTISSDASYVGLQYNPSAGTLALISPTTSKPISGDGIFRTWLYLFSFDGISATLQKHNLTGNWHAALFAYESAP